MSFQGSRFVGQGLGLHFTEQADGSLVGIMHFSVSHQGPAGIVHGGAIAAVLDEAMTAAVFHIGDPAFTASMTIDYRAPLPTGMKATITGWLERADGRKRFLRGHIHDADGNLYAEASALFILIPA